MNSPHVSSCCHVAFSAFLFSRLYLVFSTLLFSSWARFSLLPVLYEIISCSVTWVFPGLPSLHTCTASPSLALPCFQYFFCSLLSPVLLCLALPAPHPLISLACNSAPSFVQSFAVFLSSCCSCSCCLASVILLLSSPLWSCRSPVFSCPQHCRDAH